MTDGGTLHRGESRHPEWDLMYRRGLTAKRIAVLCSAVPQTVSRHLRVQRMRYPDMVADHVINRPPDKARPAGLGWQAKVEALSAFRQSHGRYPTTSDPDPANRKLAQWLSLQRRSDRAGALSQERLRLLSVLPGWAENQRTQQDGARWLGRLDELQAFRAEAGRWPRFREPVTEAERVLGVWLHAQRQSFGRGHLSDTETRLLDSKVPGWNAWRVKRRAALAAGKD